MISIIIPAHNESDTIARGLDAVMAGLELAQAEVIVVCNGCTDNTAEVARACGSQIRVIETPVPSKVHALNLGDEAATGFPRFYIDADVRLLGDAIRCIADVLRDGSCLAAAPSMQMDFSGASWAVRAFYHVWSKLDYTTEGFMGVGAYALSEEGHRRLGRFPDVLGDDAYVRMLFTPRERVAVRECTSLVTAPALIQDLIKIKTRSCLGRYQLRDRFPQLWAREAGTKRYGTSLVNIARYPLLWPSAVVYLWVTVVSRCRADRQRRYSGQYIWERDESSRRQTRHRRC